MFKLINGLMVGLVLVAAFYLYSLEHTTRNLERSIAKSDKQITQERDQMKLLAAEWASLTRPDRLQKLGEGPLGFKTLQAQQFVPLSQLEAKLAALSPPKPEELNSEALNQMLEKLQ